MAVATAIGALVGFGAPTVAQEPPSLDASTIQRVDDFLSSERVASGIPGLAIVIVGGDQIVHTAAFGVADGAGRAVTADTPFVLASLSKAFTAMCVMQLVDAGRIELDAPVQRYIPWFRVGDEAASSRITIAQLLHHSSGLGATFWSDVGQDGKALERFVRGLASAGLRFDPGDGYYYSDTNYQVLGFVVQTLTGVPFDQHVEEHIFSPLGMVHSHVLAADASADGAAEGFYRWFGLATVPTPVPYPRAGGPAAVMFSSANDMGRWLIAHLNRGRVGDSQVLSEAGMATLHTPVSEVDPDHGYAMGWVVRPYWEELAIVGAPATTYPLPALIEHGGGWTTGHTYIGLVPERHWGFAVLMNVYDRADDSPFTHVEQGVLRILAGKDPLPAFASPDLLGRNARALAIGLLGLETVSLVWSMRMLLRWRRRDGAPLSTRTVFATTAAPLLLDILVLWIVLLVLPSHFDAPLAAILASVPDASLIAWPLLVLAGIWGPIRTIALLFLHVGGRPRQTSTTTG
jgi:CubicO group peptidase (beta-lactamase class C family)